MNIEIIIIVFLLILIIYLIYQKKEKFTLNEAINNVLSVYYDPSGTVYFNNIFSNQINSTDASFNNISSNKINSTDASFNNISSNKINSTDASFNNITANNITANNITVNNMETYNENKARYVRIGNDLSGTNLKLEDYWNIASVKVYDINGKNVSDNKPVTIVAGSKDPSSAIPNIITIPTANFVKSTGYNENLYLGGQGKNALQIDLGQEYHIKQIIIWGRWWLDWYYRLNNTSIQLIDKDGVTVKNTIYTGTWETWSKEFNL